MKLKKILGITGVALLGIVKGSNGILLKVKSTLMLLLRTL